jgi:hypothetical protein
VFLIVEKQIVAQNKVHTDNDFDFVNDVEDDDDDDYVSELFLKVMNNQHVKVIKVGLLLLLAQQN